MHPGQRLCGAKTRKGVPCKDIAMKNGRCKRHGGKATGAKNPNVMPGAKAVTTFGIYSRFLSEEDQALYLEAEIGSVDAELRLVKLRLARTVRARKEWEDSLKPDPTADQPVASADGEDHLTLVEVVDDQGIDKEGCVHDLQKRIKRLPDFDKIEQACLARIESLEKTRKELLKDGNGSGDDGDPGASRDRVTFTGGLGGTDEELPSPFEKS